MINEVNQAMLLYDNYASYKFLTIKNPNNQLSDSDLLRVAYHLRNIVGYTEILNYSFEWGKQHQRHIHLIIKKTLLPDIPLCSKKYKLQKLKYLEVVRISPHNDKPGMVEIEIPTKSCVWHISPFNNAKHFRHVDVVYIKKEGLQYHDTDKPEEKNICLAEFIDDNNQPKTPPFKPIICPLYGE